MTFLYYLILYSVLDILCCPENKISEDLFIMVTPLSTKQASVSIYCDYQNVKLDEKTVSLLQNFAKSIGTLLKTKIYYNSFSNNRCLGIPNVTYNF